MATKYHIYGNGGGGGPVDYSSPIATVAGTSWASPALALGSSWRFGVRAFDDGTNAEETNVDAQVRIQIDGAGNDVTNRPYSGGMLTVRPIAGGYVRVSWIYPASARRAAWKPTEFRVYAGTAGSPSYATPVATLPCDGRTLWFATIGPYTHGQIVTVGVRAANASGEETNTVAAEVVAVVDGPAAVDGLAATATSQPPVE